MCDHYRQWIGIFLFDISVHLYIENYEGLHKNTEVKTTDWHANWLVFISIIAWMRMFPRDSHVWTQGFPIGGVAWGGCVSFGRWRLVRRPTPLWWSVSVWVSSYFLSLYWLHAYFEVVSSQLPAACYNASLGDELLFSGTVSPNKFLL